MSYILDALRKSEKERRRGALPEMLTVQDIVSERPGKRPAWVGYLLLAALVLNAGILIWWLGGQHTERAKVVQVAMVSSVSPSRVNDTAQRSPEEVVPSAASAPAVTSELRPVVKKILPMTESTVSANRVRNSVRGGVPDVRREILPERPVPDGNTVIPAEHSPEKENQTEIANRFPSEPADGPEETPDEHKIYKLKELPSSVRQGLPSFSVSALLYSGNPASRMVRINDQMLYEGQDLTGGVRLEEIARDGLIFRYQKYRFYVGVK